MKTFWVGPVLLGLDWASDWKWDWTANNGDKHSDFAAVSRFVRAGYPPGYRVTLGPICIMGMIDNDGTSRDASRSNGQSTH